MPRTRFDLTPDSHPKSELTFPISTYSLEVRSEILAMASDFLQIALCIVLNQLVKFFVIRQGKRRKVARCLEIHTFSMTSLSNNPISIEIYLPVLNWWTWNYGTLLIVIFILLDSFIWSFSRHPLWICQVQFIVLRVADTIYSLHLLQFSQSSQISSFIDFGVHSVSPIFLPSSKVMESQIQWCLFVFLEPMVLN